MKWAGVDLRARAATCAWAMTSAIRGRRPRLTATPRRRSGRMRVLDDPLIQPRALNGRAPDVFRIGGWLPMREFSESTEVDFLIVGTGAGGGTLACRLAEAGFSVIG